MADTAKAIYAGQPAVTDTLLYTAPSLPVIIRGIHIVNVTTSSVTIRLGINAGTALAVGNAFLWDFAIGAKGSYDWTGFLVVSNAGTIRALQSVAAALTVLISGIEQ